MLCNNSGADVEWLMDKFDLDLSLVARLGGHSQPRTHRGAERFPGMTITYALIQMLEKVAEHTNNTKARIVCKAKATKFLMSGKETCCGVEYEFGGQILQEHGPVIVCTGGFGADFTASGLLAKYRPDLLHLPTTNGEHCTGDGIKMGAEVGGATIDLEWVQVHPTGLVKPGDADAKVTASFWFLLKSKPARGSYTRTSLNFKQNIHFLHSYIAQMQNKTSYQFASVSSGQGLVDLKLNHMISSDEWKQYMNIQSRFARVLDS